MTEEQNKADLNKPAEELEHGVVDTGVEVEPEESIEESQTQALEALQADLAAAMTEANQLKDQTLRAQADAQNVKRRASQDVEKARKFALEKFANDLLPVVDSLERALESSQEKDAMSEGVEMTLKMLLDALKKHGVEQIDPVGHPFDPAFHQAMSMQESADVEPNTVIAVLQKGYVLNGRLVRPAMVMVSKGVAGKVDEKV